MTDLCSHRISTHRPALLRSAILPPAPARLAALLCAATLAGCAASGSEEEPQPAHAKVAAAAPIKVEGSAYELAAEVALPEQKPIEGSGLHNLFALSEDIVSGSEPESEASFQRLQEMGIHTILSVDGKLPNAELAEKYGMSYVHVPIHYSGFDGDTLLQITKTFREKEGPFYVHCFHGKHRGPAAAEVGRLVLDGIPRERALAEMRQWCGTADSYEGLYRSIASVEVPSEEESAAYAWDFPSAHPIEGFRSLMIDLPRIDDRMKAFAKRSFAIDPEHPDVDPVRDAEQMAELFARGTTLGDVQSRPESFREMLGASAKASAGLAEALREWSTSGAAEAEQRAQDRYQEVRDLCSSCHKVYRN